MKSKHDKKFVISSVALVFGRIKNSKVGIEVRNHIESLISSSEFLENAPFLWIGLIYRYGIINDLKVEFQRINKTYGDLPIALELDMEILKWTDQNNLDLLHDIFMIAALEALLQVGQKYKLPIEPFVEERKKYGNIPNTIEECESYKRP